MCILLFFLVFSANYSFAQIQGEDEVYLNNEVTEPEFPGGMEMFYKLLMKRIDHSKIKAGEKLLVTFTINELGEMKKIRLVAFKDEMTGIEVLKGLKNFPNWKPAYKLGKSISVELKIPIIFK